MYFGKLSIFFNLPFRHPKNDILFNNIFLTSSEDLKKRHVFKIFFEISSHRFILNDNAKYAIAYCA